jgi:hypothetical protein
MRNTDLSLSLSLSLSLPLPLSGNQGAATARVCLVKGDEVLFLS